MTYSGQINVSDIPCSCGTIVIIEGKCPTCGAYRTPICPSFDEFESNVLLPQCITVGECPRCGGNITKYVSNLDSIATCERCYKHYKIFLKETED